MCRSFCYFSCGAVCSAIVLCRAVFAPAQQPLEIIRVSGAQTIESVAGIPPSLTLVKSADVGSTPKNGDRILITGDNISDPFVVPTVPYSVSGTTVGFADDYHESCPLPAGGAPDVVYSYSPPANQTVSVSLCGSGFDTKLYIYANAVTPGNPLACNDDYCGNEYLRSHIHGLSLAAGDTYYIVVDGFSVSSGNYTLDIDSAAPCIWGDCSGMTPEGELCAGGQDVYNGGCTNAAEQFQPVEFDAIVCGEIWGDAQARDTDWYRRDVERGRRVRWTVTAEFPVSVFLFDMTGGCAGISGIRLDGHPCETIEFEFATAELEQLAYVVTTREQYSGYACADGPWQYTSQIALLCACACHGDPHQPMANPDSCDGVADILDVAALVNIAFRNAAHIPDPLPICPFQRGDVDCSGTVTILDVVHLVNTAFRNADPAVEFCLPCAPGLTR